MRVFIALPLPENFRILLYDEREELRIPNPRQIWIAPENYHITLHFLGEMKRSEAEKAAALIQNTASEFHRFELKTSGPGQFPHHGSPRIIYESITEGSTQCKALQGRIAKDLQREGFILEQRKFIPHITLCRLKGWSLLNMGDRAIPLRSLETTIERVALFQSILHPGGAIYEILAEFPFSVKG